MDLQCDLEAVSPRAPSWHTQLSLLLFLFVEGKVFIYLYTWRNHSIICLQGWRQSNASLLSRIISNRYIAVH